MKPNMFILITSLFVYICYKMDFNFKFLFRNFIKYDHTTGHLKGHILLAL